MYFVSEGTNKCFRVKTHTNHDGFTWQEALMLCRSGPGYLPDIAVINSPLENGKMLCMLSTVFLKRKPFHVLIMKLQSFIMIITKVCRVCILFITFIKYFQKYWKHFLITSLYVLAFMYLIKWHNFTQGFFSESKVLRFVPFQSKHDQPCRRSLVFNDNNNIFISRKDLYWGVGGSIVLAIWGYLSNIRLRHVHAFLTAMVTSRLQNETYGVYIGLKRSVAYDTWRWADNSPNEYTNWAPTEPSGQNVSKAHFKVSQRNSEIIREGAKL